MSNLRDYEPIYNQILAALGGMTLADGDLVLATGASAFSPVGSGLSWRNMALNGEMKVAQRGATITSPANGDYTLDGWAWQNAAAGPGAITVTQSTVVPNSTFTNSLKIDVTTADA